MGDRLRNLVRSWLRVDDDRIKAEAVMYQHARSLGQIRQDITGIKFELGVRDRRLYTSDDRDRPYTDDDRRQAVEKLIGKGEA